MYLYWFDMFYLLLLLYGIVKENKLEGNYNIEYFVMDCFYLFVGCYLFVWLCE